MWYYVVIDVDILRAKLPQGTSSQMRELHQRTFSIMNNNIMATVFKRLPKENLEDFARRYAANCADPTLVVYVTELVPGIQDKIRRTYEDVIQKLTPLLNKIDDERR